MKFDLRNPSGTAILSQLSSDDVTPG